MEKFQADPKNDIAREQYQGPSATVEAVGHGAIEHWLYALTGLASAGALAYFCKDSAAALVKKSRSLGTKLKDYSSEGSGVLSRSKDTITDWAGGFLHVVFGDVEAAQSLAELSESAMVPKHKEMLKNMAMNKEQGFGNNLLSHTIGLLPYVGRRFKSWLYTLDSRAQSAIAVGGIAGVTGYIGGWVKAIVLGSVDGNKGKRQFERAQAEVRHLREVNDDLEKINDTLHAHYVQAATQLKTTHADNASRSDIHTAAEPASAALSTIEHQGTLQPQQEIAAPAMA